MSQLPISRRNLSKTVAWSAPTLAAAITAPAQAASIKNQWVVPDKITVSSQKTSGALPYTYNYSGGLANPLLSFTLYDSDGKVISNKTVSVTVYCGAYYLSGTTYGTQNIPGNLTNCSINQSISPLSLTTDSLGKIYVTSVALSTAGMVGNANQATGGGYINLTIAASSTTPASPGTVYQLMYSHDHASGTDVTFGQVSTTDVPCTQTGTNYTCKRTYTVTATRTGTPTGGVTFRLNHKVGDVAPGLILPTPGFTLFKESDWVNNQATYSSTLTWTQNTSVYPTEDKIPGVNVSWLPYSL